MIVGLDGRIVAIGDTQTLDRTYAGALFEYDVDATGKCVIPGLVDAHTHPVWSGDRCPEFKMKLAGATYTQVHEMGGGIGFTVRHTHASTEAELQSLFITRLNRMMKYGTTLIEAKSGYGLVLEHELKMLRVIQHTTKHHSMDIVANYCGAHSIPKGSTATASTRDIIDNQIPAIVKAKATGEINPELIDVFCEKGFFEIEDSRAILAAGKAAGFGINFHGDELFATKSAEMGASLGAMAISHLEHISEEGIRAMASSNTVGVLLPTTAYVLRIAQPPARSMIDGDMIVALGSDFNPNAHCLSMPFVMNLACVAMKMTMNEALVAATLNSAASMGRSGTHGSLEVGKWADCVIIDATTWEHIIYQMADPPITHVYKKGHCVYTSSAVGTNVHAAAVASP